MRVLRGVTVDAISSDLGPPGHRRPVTSRTRQIRVSAMQSKTRLGVVLELPAHPTIRIVAALAVAPESLFMHIVLLVTREARHIVDRESVVAMTGLTRCDRMKSEQRESR